MPSVNIPNQSDSAIRSGLSQILGLAAFIALCFGAAGLGGFMTESSVAVWYPTLRKPSWTPPPWIFGPVWSLLYLSMAVAAWLVWRQKADTSRPLLLFAVQLALNVAWSALFFGLRLPGAALADILFLWIAILATARSFAVRSRLAGWLMVPYLLWVAFAACLNAAIWWLNA